MPTASARNPRRMRVALDIEGCLDRFYGGYYSGKLFFLCSICLMTTTTTIMIFNRLGLWWAIQSMLWVRAASCERLSIRPNGRCRLLRWHTKGKQEDADGTQRLSTKNDLGKWNKTFEFEQIFIYFFVLKVLKHIRMIGTPPPKIWWIPPSGLRACLRNALRSVEIPVVSITRFSISL